MASREERMNQRLRGAQRRQVKDVDFGLSFPSPAPAPTPGVEAAQSIEPPVPQSDLRPQRSTRHSPANIPTNPLPQEIARLIQPSVDANTSAKRRKLHTDLAPASSSRSSRSQNPPRDIYSLEDDDNVVGEQDSSILEPANIVRQSDAPDDEQDEDELQDASLSDPLLDTTPSRAVIEPAAESSSAAIASSPRKPPSLPVRTIDEVTESPSHATGSGHRTRVVDEDILASSSLQDIQDEDSVEIPVETPATKKRKRGDTAKPIPVSRNRQSQASQTTSALDELDELSPEQTVHRGRKPRKIPEPMSDELGEELEEQAEEIDDAQAAAILKQNRGRRVSNRQAAASPDLDNLFVSSAPAQKKPRGKHRVASSPVQQRQPKQAVTKTKSSKARKPAKKSMVSSGGPVPVIVHRLTKAPIYDEDELNADILNAEIPHLRRGGVNAIDVLRGLCQELVDSGLDSLQEGGAATEDPAVRREYKNKWHAVESFGHELRSRLLEHTVNLDNAYSLDRRLRDEQKKKFGLREDILRIRAEREQVALRLDEVRIRHEKEKTEALERSTLNTAIHDIELAVEMGKAAPTHDQDGDADLVGSELLIKRVADEVSNKADSGGLMRRIKEFNAFLERAAVLLEARKV